MTDDTQATIYTDFETAFLAWLTHGGHVFAFQDVWILAETELRALRAWGEHVGMPRRLKRDEMHGMVAQRAVERANGLHGEKVTK